MNSVTDDFRGALKFYGFPVLFGFFAISVFFNTVLFQLAAWVFLTAILLFEVLPIKSYKNWNYGHDVFFLIPLCFSVVTIFSYLMVYCWYYMAPQVDFLGLGMLAKNTLGFDAMYYRESAGIVTSVLAGLLAVSGAGILSAVCGHELIHKARGSRLYRLGVFAHIVTFFSYFAISHPIGHHHLVATKDDHATGRRGENFYHFALRSRMGKQRQTWMLEKLRLNANNKPVWSWHNEALRHWIFEALLAVALIYAGGWAGVQLVLIISLSSNFFMELVNYNQHYGLVREANEPIKARHVWSNNYSVMNFLAFGALRHAAHHASNADYWRYKGGSEQDPQSVTGIFTSMVMALFPPLNNYFMVPKLIDWDFRHASPAEQLLAIEASRESGDERLVAHAAELEAFLQTHSTASTA